MDLFQLLPLLIKLYRIIRGCDKTIVIQIFISSSGGVHKHVYDCRSGAVQEIKPRETNAATNIGHFAWTYIMMSKSLDWGFFSGPQARRKFVRSGDPSGGEWLPAEKNSKTQLPPLALLEHVFSQLTSIRGAQFPWGHFSQINGNSWQRDLLKFLLCQMYSLTVVGGLLYIGIEELPAIPIAEYFGWHVYHWMPSPTVAFVVRFITTPFLITCICATFEAMNSALAVCAHLAHPILCQLGFPEALCEFTDPTYYPPLFNNLASFNSLSEFWGKTWHQIFRRSFIILGSFPLGGVARGLGLTPKSQKILGFFGAFLASGYMHALRKLPQYIPNHYLNFLCSHGSFFLAFFLMADSTTSSGNVPLRDQLAVFTCFALQGLGALIEPILIPHIPKRLGGGKLWTICFLLVTVPFFSTQVSKPARLFSIFTPLDQWNILHLFLPLVIAPVCL
ncbi:uncharacterized protein VP01_1715g3 [Puccinia sorghi]|uniref:Wax synthase domain-containing protein n=1 Tax=Puccinia sorghi TaxID=27349 RepID=A0A0L6VHC6_9BASI|nr:uncharacterized protein VP01_1715g3 [Puccinia sorghi]